MSKISKTGLLLASLAVTVIYAANCCYPPTCKNCYHLPYGWLANASHPILLKTLPASSTPVVPTTVSSAGKATLWWRMDRVTPVVSSPSSPGASTRKELRARLPDSVTLVRKASTQSLILSPRPRPVRPSPSLLRTACGEVPPKRLLAEDLLVTGVSQGSLLTLSQESVILPSREGAWSRKAMEDASPVTLLTVTSWPLKGIVLWLLKSFYHDFVLKISSRSILKETGKWSRMWLLFMGFFCSGWMDCVEVNFS